MRTSIISSGNKFAFPSRTDELLVLQLEAKKGSTSDVDTVEEEKVDDGWGFDADEDVLEEARKELNSAPAAERERDLFIPLFALVSIAGFVGLYGYEMLRLYFAGELFLPFLH